MLVEIPVKGLDCKKIPTLIDFEWSNLVVVMTGVLEVIEWVVKTTMTATQGV